MARVLYVDDDDALRDVVRTWLERSGHVVHTADGVASAKQCVAAHELDGAFVDVWLDDGSGFELHGWLESHAPALARRVVFVTGNIIEGADDAGRRLRALGQPVLAKPFGLRQLDPFVAAWVREPGGGEGA